MSVHGELAGGAAQRRRERRLRSWLRHERQTVAMVLAEACHHSSGSFPPTLKERRMAGQDAYEALRGQKTARTAGLHPDELVEPGVQGRLVAHSRLGCGGAPSPSLPHLAGGDTLDDTSVHFLLEMALLWPEEVEQLRQAERRKLAREEKEKEEKKEKEIFARWTAEYLNSLSQSSSSTGKRRKKKKRKRRKLPKAPLPRCGRPCARQRQVPAVQVVHVLDGALLQFIDRVLDILVLRTETCTLSANSAEDCRDSTGAVLGLCLRLTSVVSASVRRPTLTRSSPSTSCFCHPSVAASRCRVVVDSALLMVLTSLFGTW